MRPEPSACQGTFDAPPTSPEAQHTGRTASPTQTEEGLCRPNWRSRRNYIGREQRRNAMAPTTVRIARKRLKWRGVEGINEKKTTENVGEG